MPSTVWSGTVSFGLVSIPVKLFSAVSRKTVRFNQIDTRTGARVRQKRVSGDDGSEVAWSDIAKGYEQADGEYVVLTDDELASVDVKATKTIDIEQFVEMADIDPIAYDGSYNVVPDESSIKPYALLVDALESTGKVAVARFVMRQKQHLSALRALDGRLVLSTLVYADEINDPAEFETIDAADEVEISEKERRIAESLIESLTEEWDAEAFTDTHREKVLELISRKADGATEIIEGEPEETDDGTVVDLMAALEASVEQAKTARTRHPTGESEGETSSGTARKSTAKKSTGKKTAGKKTGAKTAPAKKAATRKTTRKKAAAKAS